MNDWFIWMLFGHFFGDYLFQNDWMSLNKKSNTFTCVVHCVIYTNTILIFLALANVYLSIIQVIFIYLSHYILDRTHILDNWFKLIGTRSWDTNLPILENKIIDFTRTDINVNTVVTTSFGAIVYVVADNILHLFMMFLIVKYL